MRPLRVLSNAKSYLAAVSRSISASMSRAALNAARSGVDVPELRNLALSAPQRSKDVFGAC